MSFAVWRSKPPFAFDAKDREQIYQIGAVWVVTDDPKRATQAEVDAVLNAPVAPQPLTDGALAQVLVSKGIITKADVDAAVAQADAAALPAAP